MQDEYYIILYLNISQVFSFHIEVQFNTSEQKYSPRIIAAQVKYPQNKY
jgi:hypothetical protein